jgi:hypothetical protein
VGPHPRAAGSFGPAWIAWAEATLYAPKSRRLLRLRPSQKLALTRGLEHDAEGSLCWTEFGVSMRRQRGKSIIAYVLACARAAHALEVFGQPQNVVHVANKLVAARRIHRHGWVWAAEQGLHVSRSLDSATISWPDGSTWVVSSLSAIWGETGTTVVVDESWDVEPEVVEEGVRPTLSDVEIVSPQLWQFSTANREATATFPRLRRDALRGVGSKGLLEWSADPDADRRDPVTWRSSQPMWSPRIAEEMAAVSGSDAFATEYLNIWPNVAGVALEWPRDWSDRVGSLPAPERGLVGAVETSLDKTHYGVVVAEGTPAGVRLWSRTVRSMDAAMVQLRKWQPSVVLAGVTLERDALGPWRVEPVGTKETGWATPDFAALVRDGRLTHDGDPGMLQEVQGARTSETEAGPIISARRSEGPVPTVKAAAWASWAVVDGRFAAVSAEIW